MSLWTRSIIQHAGTLCRGAGRSAALSSPIRSLRLVAALGGNRGISAHCFSSRGSPSSSLDKPGPIQTTIRDETEKIYTPAEVSRLAASAIRKSFAAGKSRDAFGIYVDVHLRTTQYHNSKPMETPPPDPIPLGLPTITLVHGLIRAGLTHKAAHVLSRSIKGLPITDWPTFLCSRLPVHARVKFPLKTLEYLITVLCPSPGARITVQSRMMGEIHGLKQLELASQRQNSSQRDKDLDFAENARRYNSSGNIDKGTRRALTLLKVLREHRQRRSRRMYENVIDACLLQGEIITATFLFVLLVKDWQVRAVLKNARSAVITEAFPELPFKEVIAEDFDSWPAFKKLFGLFWRDREGSSLLFRENAPGARPREVTFLVSMSTARAIELGLHEPNMQLPFPSGDLLAKIVYHLNLESRFRRSGSTSSSFQPRQAAYSDSLVALGHLVRLLQEKSLPDRRISSLLRVMYSLEQDPEHLWKPLPKLNREKMKFHFPRPTAMTLLALNEKILLDLISSLPPKTSSKPTLPKPEMLPLLDRRSYNALIHYTLHHQKSHALTQKVLDHMDQNRISINRITANILLRGSQALGMGDVVPEVLARFRPPEAISSPLEVVAANDSVDEPPHLDGRCGSTQGVNEPQHDHPVSQNSLETPSTSSEPQQHQRIEIILPARKPKDPRLVLDSYSASILASAAAGSTIDPGIVDAIIQSALPVLRSVLDGTESDVKNVPIIFSKENMDGPELYVALLNLTSKAGKTGRLESIFYMAKKAESYSWANGRREFFEALRAGDGVPVGVKVSWKPWLLPISAYTIMLQSYARQSREGFELISDADGTSSRRLLAYGWGTRRLRNKTNGGLYRSEAGGQGPASPKLRTEVAFQTGKRVYLRFHNNLDGFQHSLAELHHLIAIQNPLNDVNEASGPSRWKGTIDVSRRYSQLEYVLGGTIPVPDARFYNAAMDLFCRRLRKIFLLEFKHNERRGLERSDAVEQALKATWRRGQPEELQMIERLAQDIARFGMRLPSGLAALVPSRRRSYLHRTYRGPLLMFRIPVRQTRGGRPGARRDRKFVRPKIIRPVE